MFDSLTKLFEGKNINQNMTLRNQLKNVKIQNAETIQSYFTRVSQIREQLEAVEEEVEKVEMVITTLNGLPGSWDSFIQCVLEESDYFQQNLGRAHTRRRSLTHTKRREYGSNRRSISHHPKKIPQATRNIKNSTLEEPFIHLIMNEEDDEAEISRRSLPTKQIKISIQFPFHDIVLLHICLYYA